MVEAALLASLRSIFCRACVFFAPNQAGSQELGHFVTKPFNSLIKMSQKATAHAKNDYHLTAMTKMEGFLAWYENPSQSVGLFLGFLPDSCTCVARSKRADNKASRGCDLCIQNTQLCRLYLESHETRLHNRIQEAIHRGNQGGEIAAWE